MDRCPDAAALNRWFACSMMAGDQQHYPFATCDRLFERAIDGGPSAVQIHAVKIKHSVRLDGTALQPAIPSPV